MAVANSAHITYAWHALLLWHTYLHTYIYTAPARICTPLIVSRSLCSLANKVALPFVHAAVKKYSLLVMRSNSAVGRASYARFCPTAAIPAC